MILYHVAYHNNRHKVYITIYVSILEMSVITVLTHLGHIDISNIMTYRCIDINTVHLYIQYFMIDAVVVYNAAV